MTQTPRSLLDATLRQAATLHAAGNLDQAAEFYQKALQSDPTHFLATYLLGLTALQSNRPAVAAATLGRAVRLFAGNAEAHLHHGLALSQIGDQAAAVAAFERALAIAPDELQAREHAGHAQLLLQDWQAAVTHYDAALRQAPRRADLLLRRGTAWFYLQQPIKALADFGAAIALDPTAAAAYNDRGNILRQLQRHDAAIADYRRAIELRPDHAEAHYNLGNALRETRRYEAAIASYERAAALKADFKAVLGLRLYTRMQIADWAGYDAAVAEFLAGLRRGEQEANPFFVLAFTGSPSLQRNAAEQWTQRACPASAAPPAPRAHIRHDRIRIAYCSADFHDHATLHLMAELFELHDRDRFELTLLSFGSPSEDSMRQRLLRACPHFLDVREQADGDVARLARSLDIDIAVDLKGFTQEARPGIFAARAAPLQVSYLGYPGTMGAPYMDYLIADGRLIPNDARQHYAEKIIYLPHSYQVNDRQRRIGAMPPTRQACGLPAAAFVFCCFNSVYKITPDIFDCWMRILQRVEGSVLWLMDDHPGAVRNLTREAARRGVDAARLVFAPLLPPIEHLARQSLADLFLDTLPYGAHTTASDALWAGLLLLTQVGDAFAGRVATSLLYAIGLPELCARSISEYETLAVHLALDRARLLALRQRLAANRRIHPLFDTPLFMRHLEAGYATIHERHLAGLPPEHVIVPDSGEVTRAISRDR